MILYQLVYLGSFFAYCLYSALMLPEHLLRMHPKFEALDFPVRLLSCLAVWLAIGVLL